MDLIISDRKAGPEGDPYVPEFRGNRDAPEDKQGIVFLKPLSARELRKIEHTTRVKVLGKDDAVTAYERKNAAVRERVLRAQIVSCANFFKRPGEPIRTGEELVDFCLEFDGDAGLGELLDEIYLAIIDRSKLEEGVRKN